jgi:hypothetical protein
VPHRILHHVFEWLIPGSSFGFLPDDEGNYEEKYGHQQRYEADKGGPRHVRDVIRLPDNGELS